MALNDELLNELGGAFTNDSFIAFNAGGVNAQRTANIGRECDCGYCAPLTNDTPANDWHSVAVCSDGSYDVEKGLISSFPVRGCGGKWEIVQGLPINDFSRAKIDTSVAELKEEKSLVRDLIA